MAEGLHQKCIAWDARRVDISAAAWVLLSVDVGVGVDVKRQRLTLRRCGEAMDGKKHDLLL